MNLALSLFEFQGVRDCGPYGFGFGDVAETDAQKRDAVEVTMSSQIEKLNGNIAKPLVMCSCGC